MSETKSIQRLLGYELSLADGIKEFIRAEQELLEMVPSDGAIERLVEKVPGAMAILMASGCRLLIQYDIQVDKMGAWSQLRFELKDQT